MKKVKYSLFLLATLCFCVATANASTKTDAIVKTFSKDMKTVTVNSVKPTTYEESEFLFNAYLQDKLDVEGYWGYGLCSEEDYTKCTIILVSDDYESEWDEEKQEYVLISGEHEEYPVTVIWNEPSKSSTEAVLNTVKTLKEVKTEDLNTDEDTFNAAYELSDLYLIAYLKTITKEDYILGTTAFKYAKDIINLTKGANVSFVYDPRAGNDGEIRLFQLSFGPTTVVHNNYMYGIKNAGVKSVNYLYVDKDSKDYAKSAQDRIRAYLNDDKVTVTKKDKLSTLYETECEGGLENDVCLGEVRLGWNHLNLFDEEKIVDDYYYEVVINNVKHRFVLYKGEKEDLKEPTYLASEINTNISITSNDKTVPLDTELFVNKVTSDKIKNTIKTDKYAAYDISLYSNSTGKKITKLKNGKFQVSIPVPKVLEGKTLVAVYINDKGKTELHKVTVKDGYATFETNHFSTYVLTEKTENLSVPATVDHVGLFMILGMLSFAMLLVTGYKLKKCE